MPQEFTKIRFLNSLQVSRHFLMFIIRILTFFFVKWKTYHIQLTLLALCLCQEENVSVIRPTITIFNFFIYLKAYPSAPSSGFVVSCNCWRPVGVLVSIKSPCDSKHLQTSFSLLEISFTTLRWIVWIVSDFGTVDEILVSLRLITDPLILIPFDRYLGEGKNMVECLLFRREKSKCEANPYQR